MVTSPLISLSTQTTAPAAILALRKQDILHFSAAMIRFIWLLRAEMTLIKQRGMNGSGLQTRAGLLKSYTRTDQ